MRARSGEEESFDWRLITTDAVEGAPLRKLIKAFVDVHRVTTRRAPIVLQIRRRDQLAGADEVGDARGNVLQLVHHAVRERLACGFVPLAVLEDRGCVLHHAADNVSTVRRERWINQCWDERFNDWPLTDAAVLGCVKGLLNPENALQDHDAAAQFFLRRFALPCRGKGGELVNEQVQL